MTSRAGLLSHKVAGKLGLAHRLLGPDRGAPIVLMYHGVTPDIDGKAAVGDHKHVGESLFRDQVRMMAERRRVVPLSTLVAELLAGGDCRGMLAITFDDGYLNNAECAAPVLKEFSLSATFFLATGFISEQRWAWTDRIEYVIGAAAEQDTNFTTTSGETIRLKVGTREERLELLRRLKAGLKDLDWRDAQDRVAAIAEVLKVDQVPPHGQYRFMTWDHARALVKSGFEVGAHTVNHAILSRVPLESAEAEIVGSRDRVRAEVGQCCATFCYPNGKTEDFNAGVMDICRRNFDAALSAMVGVARAADRFEIRRIGVGHETSVQRLAARILRGE